MQLPETAVKRHLLESMPIFFNILNARPMQLGDDFDYSSLEHKNGIYVVYQWFENKWVERYIGSVFSNNGTTNSLKSRVYTHITTLGHTKCGFDNYALSFKELNEFQEDSDRWRIREEGLPDKEGFADMLQSAVRENPKKFTDALDDFFKTDYFYLHRVLRGLRDVWNDGKDIDWENIFTFGLK